MAVKTSICIDSYYPIGQWEHRSCPKAPPSAHATHIDIQKDDQDEADKVRHDVERHHGPDEERHPEEQRDEFHTKAGQGSVGKACQSAWRELMIADMSRQADLDCVWGLWAYWL